MKRNTLTSIALMVIIVMMGACGNSAWDELPQSIQRFVNEYFPFGEIQSYTTGQNGSVVSIKDGATISFNTDYAWVDVNGNGEVLPQQFVYDQLPATLYNYIESMEEDHSIYRVRRSLHIITVEFLDSAIAYDENTGTITSGSLASSPDGLMF